MAKDNKVFVEQITKRDVDFPQWYTDVILKSEMVDYAPIKGFMVIRPYGFAIWEKIKEFMDKRFKESGHQNMYFPLLIPESLLKKEAEHVEGFAPEVAWVTHGGEKKLEERLCVRPTSETIICTMYSKWLSSYRELPYLYNQWNSVVRWEKTTRPFLRTSEFLWQEGHTLHETKEEAMQETYQQLKVYKDCCQELLAMPVIDGDKSDSEKFAGGDLTTTIEAMMYDGKALQAGTSHFLGQNFTKAFDITFQNREGGTSYPYHTSWGASTRLIGGLVMTHSDDRGLVLPPRVAPIQSVVIPVAADKDPKVLDVAKKVYEGILEKGLTSRYDDRDGYSVGFKFNDWEMKGVPVRVEIGPKDLEKNQAVLLRRDTLEKETVELDNVVNRVVELMDEIQDNLFNTALKHREERTSVAHNMDEFKKALEENPGFIKAMWCEDPECEAKIKEETGASTRCFPYEQEIVDDKCVYCGKPAKKMMVFAKAY